MRARLVGDGVSASGRLSASRGMRRWRVGLRHGEGEAAGRAGVSGPWDAGALARAGPKCGSDRAGKKKKRGELGPRGGRGRSGFGLRGRLVGFGLHIGFGFLFYF